MASGGAPRVLGDLLKLGLGGVRRGLGRLGKCSWARSGDKGLAGDIGPERMRRPEA